VILLVIDLVPALLSWEGRDASDAEVAAGARETIEDLYAEYRLAAVADGNRPAARLRDVLDVAGIAEAFDSLGTSAGYGPAVSARVIRRLAATLGFPERRVVFATARPALAAETRRAGISTVEIGGPDDFTRLPDLVADLLDGPLSP